MSKMFLRAFLRACGLVDTLPTQIGVRIPSTWSKGLGSHGIHHGTWPGRTWQQGSEYFHGEGNLDFRILLLAILASAYGVRLGVKDLVTT